MQDLRCAACAKKLAEGDFVGELELLCCRCKLLTRFTVKAAAPEAMLASVLAS
jgi:phage FluMu protein Com